tara:strand:- start:77 stop:865 length:789 start_codon:yes stop_codon:yes gene_type:complete
MKLESVTEIASILDKTDKIGIDGVVKELKDRNLSDDSVNQLKSLLTIKGSNEEKIKNLRGLFISNNISLSGVDLLEEIIKTSEKFNLNNIELNVDLSLARGLSYYTGTIIEVSSPEEFNIGSIGGGGRYDDLVQKNNPRLSGFGISFGFDRIYLIMEELNLFPSELDSSKSFLFLNFGIEKLENIISNVDQLREKNIICELYPTDVKIKKQMDYANQKGVDYVIIIGDEEVKSNIFKLKDMKTGDQSSFDISNLLTEIENLN